MKPQTLPFQKLRLCRIHRWTPPSTHPSKRNIYHGKKKLQLATPNTTHSIFPIAKSPKFWANKRQIPWHLQYPTSLVCPNPLISLGSPWHQIGALQSVIVPRISTDMCVSAWSWVIYLCGPGPMEKTDQNAKQCHTWAEHQTSLMEFHWKNLLYAYLGLPYKETMSWFPLKAYTLDLVLSTFRPHRG